MLPKLTDTESLFVRHMDDVRRMELRLNAVEIEQAELRVSVDNIHKHDTTIEAYVHELIADIREVRQQVNDKLVLLAESTDRTQQHVDDTFAELNKRFTKHMLAERETQIKILRVGIMSLISIVGLAGIWLLKIGVNHFFPGMPLP